MGLHNNTVFKNSCLKVPVNPLSRLPSASFERNVKEDVQSRNSTLVDVNDDKNNLSFREFYRSIPDYKEVNHLSNHEFYMKLENLRLNKNKLLLRCRLNISQNGDVNHDVGVYNNLECKRGTDSSIRSHDTVSKKKTDDKYSREKCSDLENMIDAISDIESVLSIENLAQPKLNTKIKVDSKRYKYVDDGVESNRIGSKGNSPSLHSISWVDDANTPSKFDLNTDYHKNTASYRSRSNRDFYKKSYSVPTSPIKKMNSPQSHITVAQPFKMTERDNVKKMLNEMRDYSRELENTFLKKEEKRKPFKANPVPIESRILLYDKIMEDQELRRSISKLQSTAELQAQMKPFTFTERDEKWGSNRSIGCRRLCKSNPQLALTSSVSESDLFKRKKFKAKPVPKNLFSDYIYEKMREDDYYRALNRRIRAEEMLRASSLPPSMAKRQDRECSPRKCNKYCIENESDENSINGVKKKSHKGRRSRQRREVKLEREMEDLKEELISPNTNSDKTRRSTHEAEIKKIYGSSSSEPMTSSSSSLARPKSSNNNHSINRSNLAAVLRIESSKKKLETDVLKQLEEDRYQSEIRWRDSVLRRNPAWKSIKFNHAEELSLRLQMRRDEERMRREQFLHDMELMYGRVHRQPLLFERTYSPRRGVRKNSYSKINEKSRFLEKPKSALSKRIVNTDIVSPSRTRKVSINETAETIGDDVEDYSYKDSYEDNMSKSSDDIPESIQEQLDGDN